MSARVERPLDLPGKRLLVTGGSRGLGRAIGLAAARAGARVALSYAKNEAAADEAVRAIEAACDEAAPGVGAALGEDAPGAPRVLAFRARAFDVGETEAMIRSVEQAFGGIDVLVNNAGVSQALPLAMIEEEDFDHVMRVNVKGAFVTSRAVLRGMIRRKSGTIVNIGSLAGGRMLEAPVHYATSKAALEGMTRAMAKEMARHGVRVVCLAPGLLEDGLGKHLPPHRLADYLHHCALGRVGTLDEVARACVMLASDTASFVTGTTLSMDGGV
jgi:NAD(P)-dependent dehydrogenase (short-subunit alcohol dehydrogenase family)